VADAPSSVSHALPTVTSHTPASAVTAVLPEGPFPLTEAQREIWLAIQIADGATAAYNESVSLHCQGPLHVERFRNVVHEVIARHPILSAVFAPDGESQRIQSDMTIDIPQLDLSGYTDTDRTTAIEQLIARDAAYNFDIVHGPLLRITVVKLAPEHFQVVWTSHHLVCDGWSIGVLLHDIARLYTAQSRGSVAQLGPVFPFHHYVHFEADQQTTSAYQESLQYWLQQFTTIPPALELPTDRLHPRQRSYRASTVLKTFEGFLHQDLKRVAAQNRATLTSLLLAALKTLFFRLSGQIDMVVGLTAAGQLLIEDGALVGHCVNLLPIRSQPRGAVAFSDYLATIRRLVLDGYDHQQVTYGTLLPQLPLPRVPGRLPLVEVIFNVDRDSNALEFAGLECSVKSNPKQALNFDLFFNFSEGPRGLSVQCHYNTDIFDRATIEQWLAHLEALLQGIAHNPQQSLRTLPLLTELQRQQMLSAGHQTGRVSLYTPLVHQCFEARVESARDSIVATDALRSLTYDEINRQANQLAHHLRALDVGPDTVIGVYLEHATDVIRTVLAILKAGGAYLPLNPATSRDDLACMLEDSGASMVVTTKRLADVRPVPGHGVRSFFLDADATHLEQESDQNPTPQTDAEDLACVLYTSGSMDQPQSLQIPHRILANFFQAMQHEPDMSPQDVLLSLTSLSFDLADFEAFLRCGSLPQR
jgi:non-ribosomal peptide synthetase component F